MTKNTQNLQSILIFCDGASSGNPGPSGWGAITILPEGWVVELGGKALSSTNNRMELTAAIVSLRELEEVAGPVIVYTDSVYVIRGITQWIWAWRKRGWKTAEGNEVSNADLWQKLFTVVSKRGKSGEISWKYVRGHTGIPGNERADEIAVHFSKGRRPDLYQGPLLKYPIPIHDLPEQEEALPEMKRNQSSAKATAYSYLSLVNAKPMRHRTWSACERRVKGRPGVKFKKAATALEEELILSSWGYSAKSVENDPSEI